MPHHDLVLKLKSSNPLILNLTNYVSVELVANGLLSLGASPIMSAAPEESEDLLKISGALVINLGTLNQDFIKHVEITCALANALAVPIILDPVGAGATHYRTQSAKHLLNTYQFALVRGNASEVMALAGEAARTKGVDSLAESLDAETAAKALSTAHQCVVTVSGQTDVIVAHDEVTRIEEGSPMMTQVTGTGCLFSAVTAAFCAISPDAIYQAAQTAAWYYGRCGAIAAEKAAGPGSFKRHFLDVLDKMVVGVTEVNG